MVRVDMAGQEIKDAVVPLRANAPDRIDVENAVLAMRGKDRLHALAGLPSRNPRERLPVDARPGGPPAWSISVGTKSIQFTMAPVRVPALNFPFQGKTGGTRMPESYRFHMPRVRFPTRSLANMSTRCSPSCS